MIRILLVDDHTLVRQSLALMLHREPDIEVVAQATTIRHAGGLLQRHQIDIAIVDFHLAGESGLDLVSAIRAHHPETQALVISGMDIPGNSALALGAGAAGFLPKTVPARRFVSELRRLAMRTPSDASYRRDEQIREIKPRQKRHDDHSACLADLTPREQDVLHAMCEGLDNNAIAERLCIGIETVRTHVAHILDKLGVTTRVQAVLLALHHRSLEPHTLGRASYYPHTTRPTVG